MASTGKIVVGVFAALRGVLNVFQGVLVLVFSGYYLATGWGGLIVLIGGLKLVFGVVYAIAAIGLLGERSWSRLATVGAFGLTALFRIVTMVFAAFTVFTVVWLVVDVIIIGWALTSQSPDRTRSASLDRQVT